MVMESKFEKQFLEGNCMKQEDREKVIGRYWYEFNQCYPDMETTEKLYLLKAIFRCMIQIDGLPMEFGEMRKKFIGIKEYDLEELYSLLFGFDMEKKELKRVLANPKNTITILKGVYSVLNNECERITFNGSEGKDSDYIKFWGYDSPFEYCNDLIIDVFVRMQYGGLNISWCYESPTLKVKYHGYKENYV